jgi:peroxiredoxin
MEAYRDQYATLFNQGKDVVVIAISTDADTTLASWAKDADFPMLFATDPGGTVGKLYGTFDGKRPYHSRGLFVIAPGGRVAYRTPSFRVTTEQAYLDVGAVVDSLSPPKKSDGN